MLLFLKRFSAEPSRDLAVNLDLVPEPAVVEAAAVGSGHASLLTDSGTCHSAPLMHRATSTICFNHSFVRAQASATQSDVHVLRVYIF